MRIVAEEILIAYQITLRRRNLGLAGLAGLSLGSDCDCDGSEDPEDRGE